MWHMYATFEELVGDHLDPHTQKSRCKENLSDDEENKRSFLPHTYVDKTTVTRISTERIVSRGSSLPDVRLDYTPTKQSHRVSSIYGSPGVRRKRMSESNHHSQRQSHLQHHRSRSEPSANPLLDTISVLTYDPCDSDDYYDLATVYQQRRLTVKEKGEEKTRRSPSSHHHGDGDKDSIGYAGSNSIDSGYKSLCPTPEIPESFYYGPEGKTVSSSGSSRRGTSSDASSTSSSPSKNKDSVKPKIMMGTKVMGRQCQRLQIGHSVGSRRSESALYDVNLDHLMYLRQSLLSAIQKCESVSSSSRDSSPTITNRSCGSPAKLGGSNSHSPKHQRSPQLDRRRTGPQTLEVMEHKYPQHELSGNVTSTMSSSSGSQYHKTVRFDTDVKVTKKQGPRITSNHSKSILKDSLCASLRSNFESGSTLTPDCTLEEEIDALLYGKAEYYDMENVDDFPCSYVTMIEEKYRCGKTSVAKVKKLKEKPSETAKDLRDVSESDMQNPERQPTTGNSVTDDQNNPTNQVASVEHQLDSKNPNKATNSIVKSRFTEVAKCMLQIIEDLQLKKQGDIKETTTDISGTNTETEDGNITVEDKPATLASHKTDFGESPSRGCCRASVPRSNKDDLVNRQPMSAADYHVYEEIMYDFVTGRGIRATDMPPPLPARPTVVACKDQGYFPFLLSESRSASGSLRNSSNNRPKQRHNLYSIFSDQSDRRTISKSLENEWKSNRRSTDVDDDYGFKSFPTV
ncbi:uncharacterized protein LOC143237928 isoform X2 [Tachypleus tridentatus]